MEIVSNSLDQNGQIGGDVEVFKKTSTAKKINVAVDDKVN